MESNADNIEYESHKEGSADSVEYKSERNYGEGYGVKSSYVGVLSS